MNAIQELTEYVEKQQPPGPPPRSGLIWKPQSHRWIRPEEAYPSIEDGGARRTLIGDMVKKRVPAHHAALISKIRMVDATKMPRGVAAQFAHGIITISPLASKSVVYHEIGHAVFISLSKEIQFQMSAYYMECIDKNKGFVSSYAKTNVKEFFSDSYEAYLHKPELLRKKNEPLFDFFAKISRPS